MIRALVSGLLYGELQLKTAQSVVTVVMFSTINKIGCHWVVTGSSLSCHWVVTDDGEPSIPSFAPTPPQPADASTPSTETDRRVIAALTLAGLSRKELRQASGMSEPEEVFNPRINRLLTAGYIGQRGGKLVPGHRPPPGVSP